MNFNLCLISGLFVLISFGCLEVFAFRKPDCKENYHLFHRWYVEDSKIFLIKNDNILKLLNENRELNEQLRFEVTQQDFQSFCDFYNKNVDNTVTYSPCTDQSYDVFSCFKRFIMLLNENLNTVIEKFIEYGNSNYVINEMNQSLICNHTLNEATFSTKDYFEKNCFICIKGLASTANECATVHANTITEKCCILGTLFKNTTAIKKLNSQFHMNNIYNLNKELIAGKYTNLAKNVQSICLGDLSPDNCVCPEGYNRSEKDCVDQDECERSNFCSNLDNELDRKYNVSTATRSMCVNTFGKFICARIECPASYNQKNNKCYYDENAYYRLTTDEKYATPKIYAFEFLSLPKNVYLPDGKLELFRIESLGNMSDYNYKIHKVNSVYRKINEVRLPYKVTTDLNKDEAGLREYFSLKQDNEQRQAIVYLNNEIKTDIEAQVILLTSWYSSDRKTFGITHIVLNIYISN